MPALFSVVPADQVLQLHGHARQLLLVLLQHLVLDQDGVSPRCLGLPCLLQAADANDADCTERQLPEDTVGEIGPKAGYCDGDAHADVDGVEHNTGLGKALNLTQVDDL